MPYVNVKVTKDGVTRLKKAQIVAEITATLVRILKKKPEQTHIVIDEIDTDNWGFHGMLTTDYRRKNSELTRAKARTRAPRGSSRRV